MPRYYFHIKRGQVVVLDQEGLELSGMAEADKEAARRGKKISAHVLTGDQNWWPPLNDDALLLAERIVSVRQLVDSASFGPDALTTPRRSLRRGLGQNRRWR